MAPVKALILNACCAELGVDGIIFPDLPYEEKGELAEVAAGFGVDVISLIAPTFEQRIEQIAQEATGFIYVVSSMGVTGMRSERSSFRLLLRSEVYLAKIKSTSKIPSTCFL